MKMKFLYYLVWVLLICHINGDSTENIDQEITTNFSTTTDIIPDTTTEFILESTTVSLEDDQILSVENLKFVKKDSVNFTDSTTTTNEVSFTTPSLEDTVESSTEYLKPSQNTVQEYASSSEATRATTSFSDLHDEIFTEGDTTWTETTEQPTSSIVTNGQGTSLNEVTEKYLSNEDSTIVATATRENNNLEIIETTTFKDIVEKSLLREKFDFDSPVVSGEDDSLATTEHVTNGDSLSFDVATETYVTEISTDVIDKLNSTGDTLSLVNDGTELPSEDAVTTEMISVVPDEDNSVQTTDTAITYTTEILTSVGGTSMLNDQELAITESTLSFLLVDEISSVDTTTDDDRRLTTEAGHIANDDTATTDLPTTTIASETFTPFIHKVNITDSIESFATDDVIQLTTRDSAFAEVTTIVNDKDNSLETETEHFTNGNSSATNSAIDTSTNMNQSLNSTEDPDSISNAGKELPTTKTTITETESVVYAENDSVQTTESQHFTNGVDLSTDILITPAVTETSTIIYQIPNTTADVLANFSTDLIELSTSDATSTELVSNTEANNYPTVKHTTEHVITTIETDSTSADNGLEPSYATTPIQNNTTEPYSTSTSSIEFKSNTLPPVERDWLTTIYLDSTSTSKDFELSYITESTRRSSIVTTENNIETRYLGSINIISTTSTTTDNTDIGSYTTERLDIDANGEDSVPTSNGDTSDSWGRTLTVEPTTNLTFQEPTYVTNIPDIDISTKLLTSISSVNIESTTTAGYTTTLASSSTIASSESQSNVNDVDYSTTEETLKTSSQHNTENAGLTTQETITVNNLPHVNTDLSLNLEKIEYTTEGIIRKTTQVPKLTEELETRESISENDFSDFVIIKKEDRESDTRGAYETERFIVASENNTDGKMFHSTTEKEYYVELTSDSVQILFNPDQIASVTLKDSTEKSTENSVLPTVNDKSLTDDPEDVSDQSSIAKVLTNNETLLKEILYDESIMAENDITFDNNLFAKYNFPFPYGRNIESTVNNTPNPTDSSSDIPATPSEESDATFVVIKKTSFLDDTVVDRPVKGSNPKVIYHFQLNTTHITMIGIGGGIILLTLGAVVGIWVNRRRKYEMNGQHDIP